MALEVSLAEAKERLEELLTEAQAEQSEVVITAQGEPVARLVPLEPQPRCRKPGSAKGILVVGPEFDEPLPDEIIDAFYQ